MAPGTALASDGPDPRKIAALIFAGITVYSVAKGRKVSPAAAISAALTIISFLK
jgi:hypothetical protein